MKILVLGATGMLGSTLFSLLSQNTEFLVCGSVRNQENIKHHAKHLRAQLIDGVTGENFDSIVRLIESTRPEIIINCIGLVKQLPISKDYVQAISINSLLPHKIAGLAQAIGSRLIHISTDCVFSGNKGNYKEGDFADAIDLYGRSKFLGEVSGKNVVTIRTSIIGHELHGPHGLVSWFLSQGRSCLGYTNAKFSGIPTIVLAMIIRDMIIPRGDLCGIYHVGSTVISKYDLLVLIAQIYNKKIEIIKSDDVKIDRSLNSEKFQNKVGYIPRAGRA